MSAFKIYGSSAGSGKTFTLTQSYLSLLLGSESPHYFKQILAITFTNDAAAEMKGRIIETLEELSQSDKPFSNRTQAIFAYLTREIAADTIRNRAKAAFKQILEDYSDFHIKTIDSFFNQLSTAFWRDLNLPYGYEVLLDKEPVLLKATESVLDKIGTDGHEHLSDLIMQFATDEADNNKNWQLLLPNLAKFAKELFNDLYYPSIKKNEGLKFADYQALKKQIKDYLSQIQQRLASLGAKAQTYLQNAQLSVDDFSYKKAGAIGLYFDILDAGNCDQLKTDWQPGSRLLNAIENDAWYTKTLASDKKKQIDAIKGNLVNIFYELMQLLAQERPKYLLLTEISKNLDNLALVYEVKREFDRLIFEGNQAVIVEFNRRIQQIVSTEPVPYIFERLGEKYNHILIDEFQDTSDIQFFNLLPLIENSLSKNQFDMLVGDPKQAIYRWRGGKAELMIHLLSRGQSTLNETPHLTEHQEESLQYIQQFIEPKNLSRNYRSTREIIAFNSDFFEKIAANTTEEIVQMAYADARQQTHENSKTGGHVEFMINEDSTTDELEWTKIQLQNKIEEALQAGFRYADIAILFRKNDNASQIAEFLNTLGYPIVSADSLLLKNNLAIALLISSMRTLQDQALNDQALMLYYRYRNLPFPLQLKGSSFRQFLATEKTVIDWHSLQSYTLLQLAETLADKLKLFEDKQALPYLFSLFDLIQNFVKRKGNDLAGFLVFWQQSGSRQSINAGSGDAITVTTIHKSKGLEYPVVLVPFANWATSPRNQTKAWYDLDAITFPELRTPNAVLRSIPLAFKNTLSVTAIGQAYASELNFSKLEALNLLYVAFTRPINRLYVLARIPYQSPDKTVYHAIRSFIDSDIQPNENKEINCILYQGVDNTTLEKISNPGYQLPKIISRQNAGKLRVKAENPMLSQAYTKRNKGTLLHALLSKIKTVADLESTLRKMHLEGTINAPEKEELRQEVIAMLAHPQLSPLFMQTNNIDSERDILVSGEEISRPDRVVYTENKVTILDYKTGKKQKSHETQLRHYGNLYQRMGYSAIELLLVYLNPLDVVSVLP